MRLDNIEVKVNTELIVALDTEDIGVAKQKVYELKDIVYGFKVGLPLFLSHGVSALEMIKKSGSNIFLDLKFFDIPSIVRKATEIILDYEINMFTMHILGGENMLREVIEHVVSKNSSVLPLGVTILTSMNQQEFNSVGFNGEIEKEILKLAYLAEKIGMKGLVCSARELTILKKEFGGKFKFVTPGIRLNKGSSDDQERITLPEEASRNGADYIVIGRPILHSNNSRKVTEEVLSRL